MISGMIGQEAATNIWGEYGLPGMVIGALFAVLVILVRWLIKHIDKQAESHREERLEWRTASETKDDEFRTTISETVDRFTTTIREISGKNL